MLDSFQEEVRRKRNAYAIFWGIVFVFAVLLFMFFQGYYFSIQVGFERLLHAADTSTGAIHNDDAFVKSFGIINLRVDPSPSTMTINDQTYQNGDKKILNYGNYRIKVNKENYVPLNINVELSRSNPFYLNNVRLLKTPVEKPFPFHLRNVQELDGYALAQTASGDFMTFPDGTLSWSKISLGSTGSMLLSSLWEGFLTANGTLWSTSKTGQATVFDLQKLTLCPGAQMIRGDVFCPLSGNFLTGKYRNLKEKILEANSEFIRTSGSIIRLGGTFFNSSTPLTNTIAFSGSSELVTYKDRITLLNNGHLYDLERGLSELRVADLDTVATTQKFGDEMISIGKKGGMNTLVLEDGKNSPLYVNLESHDISGAKIYQHSWAYFITTKTEAYVYYKGSPEVITLVKGEILAMLGTTVLFNRDGETYSMTLEGVE